jgi:diguanylate cyclase (GGDEF)-like protein/PAS domain S-box-containing protein
VGQGVEAHVVFAADLTIVYANDEALRILGYRWSEVAGLDCLSLVHPDDLPRVATNITGVAEGARPDPGLIQIRRADGSWRPLEVNPRQVVLPEPPDGPGSVLAVTLRDHQLEDTHWRFLADVAAGRHFERALDRFAHGLSGVVDGPMGITFHADGRRRTVGPLPAALAWPSELLGPERPDEPDGADEDAKADRPDGRVAHATDASVGDPWARAIATGAPAWALVEDLPVPLRATAVALGVGVVVVVPVPDPGHRQPALLVQCPYAPQMAEIHAAAMALRPLQAVAIGLERRHAVAQLQHLAHNDQLTGLANRARFFDRLAELHATGAPYGVCYLDVDRFKRVNDTHGHQAGDAVLRQVADTLVRVVQRADVVARLGGDEFAVVCDTGDPEAMSEVAAAVVEAFRPGVEVDGVVHDVGVSIGVAAGPDPPDELVAAADAALYDAKRDGRGTWRLAQPRPVD